MGSNLGLCSPAKPGPRPALSTPSQEAAVKNYLGLRKTYTDKKKRKKEKKGPGPGRKG